MFIIIYILYEPYKLELGKHFYSWQYYDLWNCRFNQIISVYQTSLSKSNRSCDVSEFKITVYNLTVFF